MLQIKVPGKETWDEKTEEFVSCPDTVLSLEHSLISISKWESKWHMPFLGKDQKTPEQIMDYIRCMTITPNVRMSHKREHGCCHGLYKRPNDRHHNKATRRWSSYESRNCNQRINLLLDGCAGDTF